MGGSSQPPDAPINRQFAARNEPRFSGACLATRAITPPLSVVARIRSPSASCERWAFEASWSGAPTTVAAIVSRSARTRGRTRRGSPTSRSALSARPAAGAAPTFGPTGAPKVVLVPRRVAEPRRAGRPSTVRAPIANRVCRKPKIEFMVPKSPLGPRPISVTESASRSRPLPRGCHV
jgi:hypothetical protein